MSLVRVSGLVALASLAACHVVRTNEITRPIKTDRTTRSEDPTPGRPTLVLTDAGQLRFVEPLACTTEELVTNETATEVVTSPNIATFVVGAIATAVGGVLLVRGVADDDPTGNPFTYGGGASLAAGLPLAVGPWIGNHTEVTGTKPHAPISQPGPTQPCGARPVVGKHATITARGVELYGNLDDDGVFSVSPYELVDAFETVSVPTWDVTARVETAIGESTISTTIGGNVLAKHAGAFLATAKFDTTIQPMRLVPGIKPGRLRLSLTQTSGGPAIRIVLPLENEGPGPAWALRGHVIAPGTPSIDGRVLYVGALAGGATATGELVVPVSAAVADILRNETLEVSVELRDAHGTAPSTPVRFRGQVLVDAPRP